jgi:glycerol-3-phosphate dehydrogenase
MRRVWQTQVLVVGGGATGTALARDLSLRGVSCVLTERDDINAGASGRNHGLLHSGARYASTDQDAAIECREEGALLKRLAPQCIQETGGLFVAVRGDDEGFVADFPGLCERAGIEVRPLEIAEARALEPALSPHTIAAYAVPDASVDPFKLSLENMAHAQKLGARLLRRMGVVGFERAGSRLVAADLLNRDTGEEMRVEAQVVVNAAGAWSREVATMAGLDVPMIYSKGTLLITHARVAHRVLNRLRKPSDADIIMPGGTVSLVGTTSITVQTLDDLAPTIPEVDLIVDEAAAMAPMLEQSRYVRAYCGVRPLVSTGSAADGRSVSRGFALLDHGADGLDNFVTITGGKLTTCRLMAEKAADWACERLGVTAACTTRLAALPVAPAYEGTEPGLSARAWMGARASDDMLLCECEMVSLSSLDAIADELQSSRGQMVLADLALRSRLGKGACQGTFCTLRAAAHLYNRGILKGDRGLYESRQFFGERWRGQHPILWGEQLGQAELAEAIHCGFHGRELRDASPLDRSTQDSGAHR